MNQNDRVTNDPNSDSDANRSITLPTRNPPAGDPGTNPKRGDDIEPGQPAVAGGSDDSNKRNNDSTNNNGGSANKNPLEASRNDGSKR